MARLVRARVKRVEDLPEWTKCCSLMIEGLQSHFRMPREADMDTLLEAPADLDTCRGCGAKNPGGPAVKLQCGCWAPLAILDLDEGEYPEAWPQLADSQ